MSDDSARPPEELRAKLYAAVGPDRVKDAEHGAAWGRFTAALRILWWLGSPKRLREDVAALEDRVERGLEKRDEADGPLGRMRFNIERAREAVEVVEEVGFAVEDDGTIRWAGERPGSGGPRPDALTVLVGFWWSELDLSADRSHANLQAVAERLRGLVPEDRLRYEGKGAPLYQAARRYQERPDTYAPALEALAALRQGGAP